MRMPASATFPASAQPSFEHGLPDSGQAAPLYHLRWSTVLLLAFDTATPAITAAVYDGERVLAESTILDARRHGELLMPSITGVLGQAGAAMQDVTAVVLGTALDVPVYGVCTLDAIARAALAAAAGREFLVATDARRKEVYWARYTGDGQRIGGPAAGPPAGLGTAGPVAGEGPWLYPADFGEPIEPRYPSASWLAILTKERMQAGQSLGPAEPQYLRRPDAQVPGPPKRVSAA